MRCHALVCVLLTLASFPGIVADAADLTLVRRKADPYGLPRPGINEANVPTRTSFYIELAAGDPKKKGKEKSNDTVDVESISIELAGPDGATIPLMAAGKNFADGCVGRFVGDRWGGNQNKVGVYIERSKALAPGASYTVKVQGKTRAGGELKPADASWKFTTEPASNVHKVAMKVSLAEPPVQWQGAFFDGFCKPSFTTTASMRIPTLELMAEARKLSPRSWSMQRDFWLMGMQQENGILDPALPNIVREKETRHVTAIQDHPRGKAIKIEDFFGHQQYGIESNRPLSPDYHVGDEVLIADGKRHARVKVLEVNDQDRTVVVESFEPAASEWVLPYSAAPPTRENPDVPGLFAPGGCYLRKFSPSGTPMYFWGRVDAEWDLAHRKYGQRLTPNFTDASCELSVDGQNWATAKDYAQLHEVVRTITGHLIERYGDATLDWPWSIFNEPDLGRNFWRSDWNELQIFYDYAADGVLRAFEDHGYDSDKVYIGGLELGGIFGKNLRIDEFLTHCSPRAESKTAVLKNAAFADKRLDGKRSKRVERLCSANSGKGSPCDFVSIHAYNGSKMMAEKLIHTKNRALEIDGDFYKNLRMHSHEACPEWIVQADPAYGDSYLGNGYFNTWCADVMCRQLLQAKKDSRFAGGETILTFWPWPSSNFSGSNDVVQQVDVDDDGDGRRDRQVTLPLPTLHFLALTNLMHKDYWPLPSQNIGGHHLSGAASRDDGKTFLMVYAHHDLDTQARSDAKFETEIELTGLPPGNVRIERYKFDQEHNSFFEAAKQLRDREFAPPAYETREKLEAARKLIQSSDVSEQRRGVEELAKLNLNAITLGQELGKLTGRTADKEVRDAAGAALRQAFRGGKAFAASDVKRIEELSKLKASDPSTAIVDSSGRLKLDANLIVHGAEFFVISPAPAQ